MVRAKFLCTRVAIEKDVQSYHAKESNSNKLDVGIVELFAVAGTSEENKEFFASTPNGKIELRIIRPEAVARFERGKEYYVDFTERNHIKKAPASSGSFFLLLV